MTLPLVLVSHALPDDWITSLAGQCELLIGPPLGSGLAPELVQHMPEAAGLLTLLTVRIDEALLTRAPHLRVVSNVAVGVDNVDLAACTRRAIPVGHTPGVLTDATADLAMALLLAAARRLPEAAADAAGGRWGLWSPTRWLGHDLAGATLGIVGPGRIGQAVARRAAAFGMRIVVAGRQPASPGPAGFDATCQPLDTLLRTSDFVSLHVPLTPATRGLIDAAALRRMRPNAILINTARGQVVVTDALVQALREGWIGGAALDVTDPEPLPPEHALYQFPNCLIVPHIGSATHGTRRRMAELACANLLAGLAGQRLPHCANPEVYT